MDGKTFAAARGRGRGRVVMSEVLSVDNHGLPRKIFHNREIAAYGMIAFAPLGHGCEQFRLYWRTVR